jgi:large conductance mechanosensitive channel
MATGGLRFENFYLPLGTVPEGTAPTLEAVRAAGVPVLAWGNFVTIVINFAILAFIIFQMVRAMNSLKRAEAAAPPAPAAPPEDVVLLREIRDALRK